MKESHKNKMAEEPMKKLFWKMGLPMIVSMVLQAIYNVVDSIFVTNMGADGALANQALTIAFPIQILMMAIGVGTGIGMNSILSKSLGEKNHEKINKTAGNGLFLGLCIFVLFFIFGIFGSKWFISLFAGGNSQIIEMGSTYLRICTIFSLGAIEYTIYERYLQSTGKTMLSTIAQISGALTNIVLDYVFIFPLNMGVAGAAWATVIGQFVSLFMSMYFHYTRNKEISGNLKYIKPDLGLIKEIYKIGFSAAIMQAMSSVMMAGMNAILCMSKCDPVVLIGSFGIYYKIQQIVLFSCFGLSNTIISILSFNYGMKDKERVDSCIKYGIIDSVIVTAIFTVVFELFAKQVANLFALTGNATQEIINVCALSLRISSIGFIFMGISIAIQGILQSLRYATKPLIISSLRLAIFVLPISYLFTLSENVLNIVWWTFPISEVLTSIIAVFVLQNAYKAKVLQLNSAENKNVVTDNQLIIAISRQHGTGGKEISRIVAEQLNLKFYDKEEIKNYAVENLVIDDKYDDDELYNFFLSLDAEKDSIIKQAETIRKIAENESFVIVGRGADYILKERKNVVKIFLYAPTEYRIMKIQEMYNDTKTDAKKRIAKSDKSRGSYYEVITNKKWGDKENYNLCIDCSIGNEKVANIICNYIKEEVDIRY